jgi:hypothetical protein
VKYQFGSKSVLLMFVLGLLTSTPGCSQVQQAQTKAQRVPLEKHQREYRAPINYAPREIGYDRKTGKPVTYDHKPRFELLDAKTGKYLLKWIGYDGKEKTVTFQRADAIEIIVSAKTAQTSDGRYLYSYDLQNLQTSGTYLSGFTVQNFSSDPTVVNGRGGYIGRMSGTIPQFKEGNWTFFGATYFEQEVPPGRGISVSISSTAPPGLVSCRVTGGQLALSGSDEDMPTVLEDMLPGYDEWPSGYTIGPVESLRGLSSSERAKYLLERLPIFKKAGWITDDGVHRYEELLKKGDLKSVINASAEDLRTEQTTSEVFAIIQAMK